MGWLRRGMVVSGLGGAGVLALALVDCAEPTQILVEVYSDACSESGVKRDSESTGIAVGTPAEIEDKLPTTFHTGCKGLVKGSTTQRGIGTLTITPSGDKDEEVAIKVVTGVSRPPDVCSAKDGYVGCIAHRRVTRFVPNTTQRVTVRLSLKCLNIRCDPGFTCDDGRCTRDSDLLVDGGTAPDAQTTDGSVVDGGDAAQADACTGCTDQCIDGECRVDCTKGAGCPTGNLCAPTLGCVIKCGAGNKCPDISCSTSNKCTVNCTGAGACGKVTCTAATCKVDCEGDGACNQAGGIHLDASATATLTCKKGGSCSGGVASCGGGTCELYCEPNGGPNYACPDAGARPCSAKDCTDWNTSRSP